MLKKAARKRWKRMFSFILIEKDKIYLNNDDIIEYIKKKWMQKRYINKYLSKKNKYKCSIDSLCDNCKRKKNENISYNNNEIKLKNLKRIKNINIHKALLWKMESQKHCSLEVVAEDLESLVWCGDPSEMMMKHRLIVRYKRIRYNCKTFIRGPIVNKTDSC